MRGGDRGRQVIEERYLLDGSALLAVLQEEPAGKDVEPLLSDSAIHSVNLIEVVTKLVQNGREEAVPLLSGLDLKLISTLDVVEAEACGRLHAATRHLGLSLGDCVCLSTGAVRGLTVVTKEKIWVQAAGASGVKVLVVPTS
jgi:ribonuclease VapC